MKIYTKSSKQNLPITIQEAWEFLSNPKNLKTITPDYMGFIIESGADRPMFPGQIIGVEMEDVIHYKIPMGFIGQLVHPILVKPKLDEIFDYRRKKLIDLFGEIK